MTVGDHESIRRGSRDHRRVVRRTPSIGEIDRRLEGTGAVIDSYYYCPHFVESKIERYRQECGCRKPAPGLIEQACRDLDLDPAKSFMVGDRWLDIACGRAARTRAVLIQSGPRSVGTIERRLRGCYPQ